MPEVCVGIGSNVEPARHLALAVAALEARFGAVACSSVYRNPPFDSAGGDFLNMVAAFDSELPPAELAAALKAIEAEAGRKPDAARGGPWVLDLDLLLVGDLVVDEDGLELPRDEVLTRSWVLAPLAELRPELRHPVSGRTMNELWAELESEGQPGHPLERVGPLDQTSVL